MATNRYFNGNHRSTQRLHADLFRECIQIAGVDCYYIPRQITHLDTVLNEVIENNFDRAIPIELYIDDIENYSGDGQLLEKFGLRMNDQLKVSISKSRWEQIVLQHMHNGLERPAEGDLIYVPMAGALMQVVFARHERPFYQFQAKPVYNLTLELFEYNGEKIETGLDAIDQIELSNSYRIRLNLSTTLGFEVGEVVYQDVDSDSRVYGEIAEIEGNTIWVVGTYESDGSDLSWVSGGTVYSQRDENAFATISSIEDFDTVQTFDSDAQNTSFDDFSADIIDFSETNPFGEP